jgi:flagellar biosynthetic protein FliQ
MSYEAVVELSGQAMWLVAQVAGPIVVAGLVVGLIVSVFQAATQIQEQSLAFVPKVAAMMAVLFLAGGWMLTRLVDFTRSLILMLPNVNR